MLVAQRCQPEGLINVTANDNPQVIPSLARSMGDGLSEEKQ
jgi:hypothetical protein